jgi:O-acetyl-ADP-ribose deacetylase (regulator of RNase III)
MKVLLIHRPKDHELGDAWRRAFGDCAGVDVVEGDICRVPCDAVVSPANSFGFMDGGLDLALSQRFGWHVQDDLRAGIRARPMGELLVGEALVLATGDPDVPWLISAPTMRVPMRVRQSVNAYLAMKAVLVAARAHAERPVIETIAVPGLATGTGGIPAPTAARQMRAAYDEVAGTADTFPDDFPQAQRTHRSLNPDCVLYD